MTELKNSRVQRHLTIEQRSRLIAEYRETFFAASHGDALRALYSTLETSFGVRRDVLRAEIMADRAENAKLYRKLDRELRARAAQKDRSVQPRMMPQQPAGQATVKLVSAQTQAESAVDQIIQCLKCCRKFQAVVVPKHAYRGQHCDGSGGPGAPAKRDQPPPMATTLAKWNIESESAWARPPGQRIERLVVNFDTGNWQTTSVLGEMGYHVGRNGLDKRMRRAILAETVQVKLVPATPAYEEYVVGWGTPGSRLRVKKIRDSIAAFARIRRHTKADYTAAVADWECDLEWLKTAYAI